MPGNPQGQLVKLDIDTILGLPGSSATNPTYLQGQRTQYNLLLNQTGNTTGLPTATAPYATNVTGGDYVWRVEGTFGGGTVTLQFLGLDGTTWLNQRNQANTADVTATANASIGVGAGQGSTIRALVTGATGANLNSTLAGL